MNRHTTNPFDDTSIAAGYEAWYSTVGLRADRLEKSLLKQLLATLPTTQTILDVGCGTGHFTRWFSNLGLNAKGLDRASAMLSEAIHLKRIDLVHGDAQQLPYVAGAFDLVALITTLEFLQDPLQALIEARRVSRIGLLLGTINRSSWVGWKYRQQGGPIWGTARFFTPHELVTLVREAYGDTHGIIWRTTLWPFCQGSLPLPWGGFIGMAVRWVSETKSEPSAPKDG
ncbi:MAG: class I SAM-dependent methyltransferase [Anaerolineales bacterium]|nr:MAG: class I SAM-dependent methyltransferase [Anaerolineales bacterium]